MAALLDPRLTFGSFTVGPHNRSALEAARRAAESPGSGPNPLVFFGATASGKTHLLNAIAHQALAVNPELGVLFDTLEGFLDRLAAGTASGTYHYLNEHQGLALLLLDDVQKLAGRGNTQSELLWLWEAMIEEGSQIVLTSALPPSEVDELDRSLAARFANPRILCLDAPAADPVGSATGAGIDASASRQRGATMDGEVFLSDVATSVERVLDTTPWRQRVAGEVLRWGGEGIATRRLERLLEGHEPADLDALLARFAADVDRLVWIRERLEVLDPLAAASPLLLDPDRLPEAERLLSATEAAAESGSSSARGPVQMPEDPTVDRHFFDVETIAWSWTAWEQRLPNEPR